jgi:hypothetical protein
MGQLCSWIDNEEVSEKDDNLEVVVVVAVVFVESIFSWFDPFGDNTDGDFLLFSIGVNEDMVHSRNKAAVDVRTIVAVVSGDGAFMLARILIVLRWSS